MASGQSVRWLPSNSRCPSYRNYSNSRRASLLAIAQCTAIGLARRPSAFIQYLFDPLAAGFRFFPFLGQELTIVSAKFCLPSEGTVPLLARLRPSVWATLILIIARLLTVFPPTDRPSVVWCSVPFDTLPQCTSLLRETWHALLAVASSRSRPSSLHRLVKLSLLNGWPSI